MARQKRITLHPLKEDGSLDLDTNLYPKTLVDGVVDRNGNAVDIATQQELDSAKSELNASIEHIQEEVNTKANSDDVYTKEETSGLLADKQDTLVSGVNIKTVNGYSLLGSEDIEINSGVWGNITGTLSAQEDLQTALNAKQDTLVSGTSIKTINGNDVLGEGNIAITTYQPFPASWPVDNNHTAKQFCDAIDADSSAVIGMGYFGGAKWSDKPAGLSNGDVVVEILEGPNHTKAIHLIMTSSSVYPYRWEYTYWSHGSTSPWRGVQPEITSSNKLSASYVSGLASVATSGNYSDLSNKPTIPTVPTDVSAFNNDAGYITNEVNDLVNYTLSSELSSVATSGSYNDLEDTPDLSDMATQTWVGEQGYLTSVAWTDVSGKPSFATVATSGDYTDLLNKPTIPTTVAELSDASDYVKTTRTINNKALSSDITLSASDVSALPSDTTYVSSVNGNSGAITGIATTSDLSGYVPTTRKVNNKALSSDISLTASDVGALADNTSYLASASTSGNTLTITPSSGSAIAFTPTFTDTDTWRAIKVNGTEKLGTATSTGPLDLQQGTNVSITESSGVVTISATDTTYSAGTGIDITSGVISVDSTVVALQSDLPDGEIDINFNGTATVTTEALSNVVVGTKTYTITSTSENAVSGGATLSLVTTGEKYNWNSKQDALPSVSASDYDKCLHTNASTGALEWTTVQGGGGTTVVANPTLAGTEAELVGLTVGSISYSVGDSVNYLDTEPTADNTNGRLIFVVLDHDPSAYYEGYYYIITAPQSSGYQVTVTNNYTASADIYDGQDNTGTSLGTLASGSTETYTITSGYIYASTAQAGFTPTLNGSALNPYEVSADISLYLVNAGGSN